MSKKTEIHDRVRQCWNLFCDIAKVEGRSELIQRFEPDMQRFELGLFRVVIMGEIKKGKTSFINALLGVPDLLPVESDIATSVVFKVMYGQTRKFKIFFQPDIDTGNREEPLEITQDQLRDYGTETGNPQNEKRVDFIGVEEPNPMLLDGIVIVDTPGVGGLHKAHRAISWKYAPNADAIFFVLDSVESVMSSDEVEFLTELCGKFKKQVFFVQTKIDAVDSEQVDAWQSRNKDILQNKVGIAGNRIRYFPISSKLKNIADESHDGELLQESGFLTLLNFIHRGLKAKKDEMTATHFVISVAPSVKEIYIDLQGKQKMLMSKGSDEITTIRKNLDKAKNDLTIWERDTFPKEMQNFRNQFEDIKRKYFCKIQEEMDPNGHLVYEFIKAIQKENFNPNDVVERSKEIQDNWLVTVSNRFKEIHAAYKRDVTKLTQAISANIDENMSSFSTELVPIDNQFNNQLISADAISTNFNTFDKLRNDMYGGIAGGTMATIAVGLVSLVFPPVAAAYAIAPFIGGWFGGTLAHENLLNKQREEVINKLKQNIQVLASRIIRSATTHLSDMNVTYERKINDLFRCIVDDARKRLESQSEQAGLALKQTKEENEKNLNEIKKRITKVDVLLKLMKTFLKQ
jgi:hypothetical protein